MLSRAVYLSIILALAGVVLFEIPPSYSGANDRCNRIVGEWGWFIGGKVNFTPTNRAKWTPGAKGMQPASGSWTCDPRSGTYTVTWQNGFVDTLKLSDDGGQLSGTSSTGVKVSGTRISGAAPSTTNRPTSRATTQTQGQDGWTPIGPGGFGKQAPVPMGPGGVPQRIGPQGRPPPKPSG
ncbi:MAG TPA: hypothetical protein VGK77_21665 [Candidatus Binatia bacterium]|jgi:hypothetical protein